MFHRFLATALGAVTLGAQALDVGYFGAIKSYRYTQTNSSYSPVLLTSNAYAFNAFAVSTNGMLTNATVKPPNTTPVRTLTSDTNRLSWQYEQLFQSQTELDATYPSSGTLFQTFIYTFTLRTINDGVRTASPYFATLGGSPPTPQITNLAFAQSVDTTRPLTLRWPPSGGSFDIVQLSVLDVASNIVFASGAPLSAEGLTGASNSCTLRPNTLPPGANLTGHLTFARPHVPDTNSYAGAYGIVAMARDTAFPITTRPAPVRPVLTPKPLSGGAFRLILAGETNRFYHVQATTNWSDWLELFVTNLPTTQGSFTDTQAVSLDQRFYRIQVGP
jgi:hypothetical protein